MLHLVGWAMPTLLISRVAEVIIGYWLLVIGYSPPFKGGVRGGFFIFQKGGLYQVQVIAYNWCWVSLRFTQPTFYY